MGLVHTAAQPSNTASDADPETNAPRRKDRFAAEASMDFEGQWVGGVPDGEGTYVHFFLRLFVEH